MEEKARRRDEAKAELLKALHALRDKLDQNERIYSREREGPPAADSELIADQDTAVALAELLTESLIEFKNDEDMRLTDAGVDYAWALYHAHTPKEMVALALVWERIREHAKEEEEAD